MLGLSNLQQRCCGGTTSAPSTREEHAPLGANPFHPSSVRRRIGTTPQNRSYHAPMSPLEKVFARLRAVDERLARLRVEKIRLAARASQSERRRDTRRKILIGGAVLAAIEHEGVPPFRRRRSCCGGSMCSSPPVREVMQW